MPAFSYRAVDQTGKPLRGVVEAPNASGARRALRDRNLIPTSVELTTESAAGAGKRDIDLAHLFRPRIGNRALAALTRQRDWLQRQIANASRGPSVRLGRYNPDYDREARGG